MGKNDSKNQLQADRDAKVAEWRAATEEHAAADAVEVGGGADTLERKLADNLASQARCRKQNVARLAEAVAAAACARVDVAERDDLAVACDLDSIVADLEQLEADRERLRVETEAVDARWSERLALANDAHAELTARRNEQGLPPPQRLPERPKPSSVFGIPPTRADHVAVLRKAAAAPPAPAWTHDIKALEREEREIRETIELAHRKNEKLAKERAESVAAHERRKAEQAAREEAEREAWREVQRKHVAEQEAVVAAQRAREAGGAAPTAIAAEPANRAGWRSL